MMKQRKGDSLEENENNVVNTQQGESNQRQQSGSTLNNMMKSSTDPKVQELSKQIELLKKQRAVQMAKMRESQYRLNYKKSEQEAIAKLSEMEKKRGEGQGAESLAKLKRLRHAMEFKISTESLSLAQEKSVARKVSEVNAQIEVALKSERLKRKMSLVSKDIDAYQSALNDLIKSITETDTKLDELYSAVRKALGIQRRRPRAAQQQGERKPVHKQQEVNLEDIVIIKKRDTKAQKPPAGS